MKNLHRVSLLFSLLAVLSFNGILSFPSVSDIVNGVTGPINTKLDEVKGEIVENIKAEIKKELPKMIEDMKPMIKQEIMAMIPDMITSVQAQVPAIINQMKPLLMTEMTKMIQQLLQTVKAQIPQITKELLPEIDKVMPLIMKVAEEQALKHAAAIGSAAGRVATAAAPAARRTYQQRGRAPRRR